MLLSRVSLIGARWLPGQQRHDEQRLELLQFRGLHPTRRDARPHPQPTRRSRTDRPCRRRRTRRERAPPRLHHARRTPFTVLLERFVRLPVSDDSRRPRTTGPRHRGADGVGGRGPKSLTLLAATEESPPVAGTRRSSGRHSPCPERISPQASVCGWQPDRPNLNLPGLAARPNGRPYTTQLDVTVREIPRPGLGLGRGTGTSTSNGPGVGLNLRAVPRRLCSAFTFDSTRAAQP